MTTRTVTIERTYATSPQVVFDAWRDVEVLTTWWGCAPEMLWRVHEWAFEVGGAIRVSQTFGDQDPGNVLIGDKGPGEKPAILVSVGLQLQ